MARWVTRQARYNYRCTNCNIDLVCPKCGNTRKVGTPLGLWLRQLEAPLDSKSVYNSDIDHVWWHYKDAWFITIEEKQFNADINRSQMELINIFSERLLRFNGKQNTLRGFRDVEYRGHYNIIFENSGPLDSNKIRINGRLGNIDALVDILRFGRLDDCQTDDYTDKIVIDILETFLDVG